MPLTNIEIEQVNADSWVALIEVGGLKTQKRTVKASSFDGVMAGTDAAYREMAGVDDIKQHVASPPGATVKDVSQRGSLPPLRDGRVGR